MLASYSNVGSSASASRSYTLILRTFFRNSNVCAARDRNCSNSARTASTVYASGLISDDFAAVSVRSGNRNNVASYALERSHPKCPRYVEN